MLELKEVGESFSLGTHGAGRPLSAYTQEVADTLLQCEYGKVYGTRVDNLRQFVAAARAVGERLGFSVKIRHEYKSTEVPDIAADVEFSVVDRIKRERKPKAEANGDLTADETEAVTSTETAKRGPGRPRKTTASK